MCAGAKLIHFNKIGHGISYTVSTLHTVLLWITVTSILNYCGDPTCTFPATDFYSCFYTVTVEHLFLALFYTLSLTLLPVLRLFSCPLLSPFSYKWIFGLLCLSFLPMLSSCVCLYCHCWPSVPFSTVELLYTCLYCHSWAPFPVSTASVEFLVCLYCHCWAPVPCSTATVELLVLSLLPLIGTCACLLYRYWASCLFLLPLLSSVSVSTTVSLLSFCASLYC